MSKLSSVLPGEAPASPIIVAGSKGDCECMRDGDGDVGLGLGGSTVNLWAKVLSLSWVLSSFVSLFSLGVYLSLGFHFCSTAFCVLGLNERGIWNWPQQCSWMREIRAEAFAEHGQ